MRGYVLPVVLALLLAAPMLWRLDSGVLLPGPGGDLRTARVLFEEPDWVEPLPETLPETLAASDGGAHLVAEPAGFAAVEWSADPVEVMPAVAPFEAVLPRTAGPD